MWQFSLSLSVFIFIFLCVLVWVSAGYVVLREAIFNFYIHRGIIFVVYSLIPCQLLEILLPTLFTPRNVGINRYWRPFCYLPVFSGVLEKIWIQVFRLAWQVLYTVRNLPFLNVVFFFFLVKFSCILKVVKCMFVCLFFMLYLLLFKTVFYCVAKSGLCIESCFASATCMVEWNTHWYIWYLMSNMLSCVEILLLNSKYFGVSVVVSYQR